MSKLRNPHRISLNARFSLLVVLLLCLGLVIVLAAAAIWPLWLAGILALAILVPMAVFLTQRMLKPMTALLEALTASSQSFRDGDFSITISNTRNDELGDLVDSHNSLAQLLRDERYRINQRELLLDTVIQATPVAMLLIDERQRVAYSNVEARKLFAEGRRFDGSLLEEVIAGLDSELAQAVEQGIEGLITVEGVPDSESYYLSSRYFRLNDQHHRLVLVRRMTREINRQEVNTWKKVIRVISHELNNSLAPISSLAHSGRVSLQRWQDGDTKSDAAATRQLDHILATIQDRSAHLKGFIESYAQFARLPAPRTESVDLRALLLQLQEQFPFELELDLTRQHFLLDPRQMEQVLINLLKNAVEASPQLGSVQLNASDERSILSIRVKDEGSGMSEEVLASALLPFYSTKQEGTGLGLPLCREIVESHGGRLSLRNRAKQGLEVLLQIPVLTQAVDSNPG